MWPSYFEGFCCCIAILLCRLLLLYLLFYFEGFCCCICYFTLNDFAYFESMERNFGIEPKVEHYACMIDLFGRVGLLEEAYELIAKMPMEASIVAWGALLLSFFVTSWGTLLIACRMHGNVEMEKLFAFKLLELDRIYSLLANICVHERRWGDVKMIKSMMREKGVSKTPGRSLIEIGGEFCEFLVADKSHPQSEEIY